MRSFLIAAILVALGIVTWRHFATDVRGPWGGLTREAPSLPSAFRFPVEEDEEAKSGRGALSGAPSPCGSCVIGTSPVPGPVPGRLPAGSP